MSDKIINQNCHTYKQFCWNTYANLHTNQFELPEPTEPTDDNPIISEEHATLLHLQTQVVRAGLSGDWEKARMYREWANKYRQVIEEDYADEA